ncbi:hypothetical protein ACLOJK_012051 [Asimina triloba]
MDGEIKKEFEMSGFSFNDGQGEEILRKCLPFCINYKLSASDLVSSWEVYYLNRYASRILDSNHEDAQGNSFDTPVKEYEMHGSEQLNSTPGSNGRHSSSRNISNHLTPFGQRTNKFVLQISFNNPETNKEVRVQEDDSTEDDVIRRSLPERGCRFMYDRIEDKFNFLEGRIQSYAAALVESGQYGVPTDATFASQYCQFEIGVEHSGGQHVRLDLQTLKQFSLFPGQVIGIEGHNPSGHCLTALRLVDSLPFPVNPNADLPPAKKQAVDEEYPPITRELSLVIAAGPYTTTDNLLFEPFVELLSHARRKQPQLLVLLQDYVEHMGNCTRVILMPATRDAHHDFVFPQPAFDLHLPDDLRHHVIVSCCTDDVLKHLSSEEISRIPADGSSRDRMGRLATHVLNQRSFYPLHPPALGFPLDHSLAPEALHITSLPNILILPSDLAPFIKVLSPGEGDASESPRCICVNSGRLAKGISGGTFIELNYIQDAESTNASIIRI